MVAWWRRPLAPCPLPASALATTAVAAPAEQASGESVLDKWLRTKTANLGVNLTFPPLQFRDPNTNTPTGSMIELTNLMMTDLGITANYVEIPFSQLFAAQAAGQFDMMGIAATILPSRALRGWLRRLPGFLPTDVGDMKPDSPITSRDQLNNANVRLAVVQGTSQEYTAGLLFPQAQFASFPQQSKQLVTKSAAVAPTPSSLRIRRSPGAGAGAEPQGAAGRLPVRRRQHVLHANRRHQAQSLGVELAALSGHALGAQRPVEQVGRERGPHHLPPARRPRRLRWRGGHPAGGIELSACQLSASANRQREILGH